MSMFLRFYFSGRCRDVSLQDIQYMTVGSGLDDSFQIGGADLVSQHVCILNKGGNFEIQCRGKVFLNGTVVSTAALKPSQIYVISREHRISMLVIENYSEPTAVIDVSSRKEISVGRNVDNDFVLPNPIVSGKHACIKNTDAGFVISDCGSMNGTYMESQAITERVLRDGDAVIIGDSKIVFKENKLYLYNGTKSAGKSVRRAPVVEKAKKADEKIGKTADKNVDSEIKKDQVLFKRSPRLKLEVPAGEIVIQAPPNIGTKPEVNWLSVLLPAFGTICVSILSAFLMGRSLAMLAISIPMAVIGIIVSIVNFVKQNRKHKNQENLRLAKYTEHLDDAIDQIEEKQEQQRNALISADPDTSECFNIVRRVDRRLWERRPTDTDFMRVRIGSGETDFSVKITAPRTALSLVEDKLLKKATQIYDKYQKVKNIPIDCPILNYSTCGIVGDSASSLRLVNNILVQVATHHSYNEVKTVFVIDEIDYNELSWVTGLPHAYNDEKSACYIAKNKKEVEKLFGEMETMYKERLKEAEEEHNNVSLKTPYYLFVITSPNLIKGETFSKYLYRNDNRIGLGAIFIYDSIEVLPKECNIIIEVDNYRGKMYNKEVASSKREFCFDVSSADEFKLFGESIKKIYCDDMNAEATIRKSISFYEVLGVSSASEINLSANWQNSNIIKSMSAPLGVKEKDELVSLDLHENAHGPHGLVAGTTGSGKSEILQAYILSMASLYHPYEVGFVIIDFKGGGMANQFEELPHLIGAITNIDGKEIDRSLLSIKAELDKRQRLFAESGVNKIDHYIELFKAGKVEVPLPHLIIIVDEFAELKADQPEFMQELISAARIGRSLGIHLILATQKPAGQVNDQIWSNSKFKLCLKVQDKNDSQEVLKSPLAAKITLPGRAYLKVGNDEVFELFQSGYSGAKVMLPDGSKSNQLDEIVKHVKAYCETNSIKPLPPICLPSLKSTINYDERLILNNINESRIPVGVYDQPTAQMQGPAYLDVSKNTFVVGSAQMGKTNLLQNIIRTLSTAYTPAEVNMYIIDFGSMTLKNFEPLNHVGGVVLPDEDEKLKNLFKLLTTEIERRKQKTIEVGVSSYEAYLDGGYKDLPRMIILLDNFVVFKELYGDEYDSVLGHVCRDGLAYGISIIATSTQTNGLGYRYLNSFSDRIAFTCNDSGEYSTLFNGCRQQPSHIAGRALYKDFECVLEMQTFLAFEGVKEIERSAAMKAFIAERNEVNAGVFAKKIPNIPDVLNTEYIKNNYDYTYRKYNYILGLDYATVDIVSLDFNSVTEFAIIGKSQERKQEAVMSILTAVKNDVLDAPVDLYIIDSIERPLKSYSEFSFVEKYTIDYNAIDSILEEIEEVAADRYDVLVNESREALDRYPLKLVVINSSDVIDHMSSTKDVLERYRKLSKKLKALKICFIFSNVDNVTVSFGAPEMLKKLKEEKSGIITDNLKETVFYDIAPNIVRNAKALQQGDMFFMADTNVQRIKIVKD